MLDLSKFDPALKEHYTAERVEDMTYKRNPAYAIIPKYTKFGGKSKPIPLIYGNPQGRSAQFSQAKTRGAATSTLLKDFDLTRVKNYSVATLDNETLLASQGNMNAFVEAATTEIDGCINTITNDHCMEIFRSGYGARGKIAAGGISSATITLDSLADIANFEVGMEFVLAESEAGHVLRDSGDSLTIIAVDRSAGTFTASGAISGIASSAAGDFIFVKGDRENSATPARTKISGFEAWLPTTAPGSTAFFGVDRTADVTRLAGLRKDLSAMPIEEALIEMETLVNLHGGAMDHIFINNRKMGELKKALGSKVQYCEIQANARISFKGVELDGEYGTIKVLADRSCQLNKGWGLQLDLWKLYSLGEAVRVLDTDGLAMLRMNDEDGVEVRYGGYLNLGCRGPGYNINATL